MAMASRHLQQRFSFEVKLHPLRLQPVAGLSTTTSQLLKKSKLLKEASEISGKGEFVYGLSPCLAALKANRRKIHAIYMKPGNAQLQGAVKAMARSEILKLAKEKEVEIRYVHRRVLEHLTGKSIHEGFVVDADPLDFEYMKYSESKISSAKREESPLWLVLNKTNDPITLGAIIRSAYFFGVDRIITLAHICCPLSPFVSMASSGAMEMIPIYALSGKCSLPFFLFEARGNGWTVLETVGSERMERGERRREEIEGDVEEAKAKKLPVIDCYQYRANGPTVVVLGSKSYGTRTQSKVEKVCTAQLTVTPPRELPQEFNYLSTSVAAGIILHSLQKRKQTSITNNPQVNNL